MSLINCKNNRNTCGTPLPSTCVAYTGLFTGVLKESDFACNVNLDDIVDKLSVLLKTLTDALTAESIKSTLNKTNIDSLTSQINTIKDQLLNLDATKIYVNIDLGCLASDASPCEISTKKYSLFSILQLFKNEICLLKS